MPPNLTPCAASTEGGQQAFRRITLAHEGIDTDGLCCAANAGPAAQDNDLKGGTQTAESRQPARLNEPRQFPVDQGQIRRLDTDLRQQLLTVGCLADDPHPWLFVNSTRSACRTLT